MNYMPYRFMYQEKTHWSTFFNMLYCIGIIKSIATQAKNIQLKKYLKVLENAHVTIYKEITIYLIIMMKYWKILVLLQILIFHKKTFFTGNFKNFRNDKVIRQQLSETNYAPNLVDMTRLQVHISIFYCQTQNISYFTFFHKRFLIFFTLTIFIKNIEK